MSSSTRLWREFQKNWDTWIPIIGGIAFGVTIFGWDLFQGQVNTPSLTLAVLGLVAISILRDRRSNIKKDHQSLKVFEQQDAARRFMIGVASEYTAKKAVLLKYSSASSSDLVRVLLNQGAEVTIFIQHEDAAASLGSQMQVDRIRTGISSLQSYLRKNPSKANKLKVYKFRTPSTVSAIKIDNRVLCMGWYVYERVDLTVGKYYGSDTTVVSGHDKATVVAWEGTDEFEALDKTFSDLEKHYRSNAEEVPL